MVENVVDLGIPPRDLYAAYNAHVPNLTPLRRARILAFLLHDWVSKSSDVDTYVEGRWGHDGMRRG